MSHFQSCSNSSINAEKNGKRKSFANVLNNFEDAVDKQHIIHPQILASSGDLAALKDSIFFFSLSLKEIGRDGATLLHHAARTSQLTVMKYLVEEEAELDAADSSGNTPLHLSILACHIEDIHFLLEAGDSSSKKNLDGNTLLHLAAKELTGKAAGVCFEHSVGVDVTGPRNRTVLHAIAEADNIEAFKLFKSYCEKNELACTESEVIEELSKSDDDGFTAIHLAARKNSHQVLREIFRCWKEQGYAMDSVLDFIKEENSTPLHVAVDAGNY